MQRILLIRRDNIGDLVCTLPLIAVLRAAYPNAWIGALVTRYNAEVLRGNPDLNAVFHYTKAKHLAAGESAWGAMWARIKMLWQLRRLRLDCVLLPASGQQKSARRMARLVGAQRIVAQDDVAADPAALHEVLRTANLLGALQLSPDTLPPARLYPAPQALVEAQAALGAGPVLGLHISARKPSQRWSVTQFADLIAALHARQPTLRFALFWAPGASDNPLHPGDDDKAQAIVAACAERVLADCLIPHPTHSLQALIAGLAVCDRVVCSDGGHMHLAAALGKPMVALFGQSDAARWHPWGVPHVVLQPPSQSVADVRVDEVLAALAQLA